MVAWQPVGIAMGVYDMTLRYLGEREQFGTSLASFQISQEKLARMLGHIQVCLWWLGMDGCFFLWCRSKFQQGSSNH